MGILALLTALALGLPASAGAVPEWGCEGNDVQFERRLPKPVASVRFSLFPGRGQGAAHFKGWRQRRPGKRAKSRSVVTSSTPDSIARAAR